MIVKFVKSVEVYDVRTDDMTVRYEEFDDWLPTELSPDDNGPLPRELIEMRTHLAHARKFIRPGYRSVWLANSHEVANALGIQFEAFEEIQNNLFAERERLRQAYRELHQLKHADLWTRIKWVFTGVKP